MSDQFAVLVPVKPPAHGKSRLIGVTDQTRRDLAEAFALDTVTACLEAARVAQVLVVTDDAVLARAITALGAHALPDGAGDLNGTLRQSAAEARRRWGTSAIAAVCADLPTLRADELDAALELAAPILARRGTAFLADAAGVGTTLYCAGPEDFDPRFGGGSRAAHREAGAVELALEAPTARRDVDDLLDLRAALPLGLGRRTAQAVSAAGLLAGLLADP